MKKILYFSLFILLVASSCKHETDFSPRKINYDRDVCAQCLMGIAEQKWAVQAINNNGDVLWFDDIGCLNEYMKSDAWKKFKGNGKVKIWVGDSENEGKWLDAEKAYYTFGKHTPMGYGYSAVAEKKDSSYSFQEVLKRIDEGKTMRESFLKEHKMMGKKMKMNKKKSN